MKRDQRDDDLSDEEFELTEEQEAFLEESVAQIERGEYIDGDEAIRELRRRRGL
ncbi:MAG TPA: hypothetical protein VEK57_20000 [Thermoanaerobaculia bacterium]|nr:hypothetical protein [Thermoanaerobaculia bacterium]